MKVYDNSGEVKGWRKYSYAAIGLAIVGLVAFFLSAMIWGPMLLAYVVWK